MADWVLGVTADRTDAEYRLIYLIDFDLPVFSDAALPATLDKTCDDERVQRFSDELDACDGNVFITAEYNHGIPGAFKNAIDHVGPELFGKPLAFVSYGAAGGVRAVEQWRQVAASTCSTPQSGVDVDLHRVRRRDGRPVGAPHGRAGAAVRRPGADRGEAVRLTRRGEANQLLPVGGETRRLTRRPYPAATPSPP